MDKKYRKEWKCIIWKELKDFRNTYPLTLHERLEVQKWVADINSIYTNPWYLYRENGKEMNYLDALRFEEELYEEMVAKTQAAR